jgi:hypothetical protein
MQNIDIQMILQRLSPIAQGDNMQLTLWGIFLYAIFFLTLLFMARQKTTKQSVTIMAVAIMLFALIDKVGVGYATGNVFPASGCGSFPVLFMRAGLFILPLLAFSIDRESKARGALIMVAIIAFVYFWLRGMVEMQLLVGGAGLTC